MVNRLYSKKIFWLAITFLVIANLLLGNHIFAKQLTIKAADVDKIKTVLDMTKTIGTVADMILDDKDFLTILNTVIGGGKTATDVTYGLVVLSALGEMDLIDLVISQEYKSEAREYFNRVLDERISLRSYWKGVGADIPKVLSGYITGPAAALTLNSFAITDKAIAIFVEFSVLEKMKLYDGLWYYFDTRKQGNEPHEIAWKETKEVLGWAVKPSFSFRTINNFKDEKETQLENQFLALYEKWSPYVTPYGISEKYKKQLKNELSNVLIAAAKENSVLAEKEPRTSLIDKLVQQLNKIKEATATLISQINPLKAGVALNLPAESGIVESIVPPEELSKIESPSIESQLIETELELKLEESSENSSRTIELSTTTMELSASTTEPVLEPELLIEPAATTTLKMATTTPELEELITEPIPGSVFCERGSANPLRFRVFINEVAWMGTANSTNDEWIELKNVWGIPVNLSGWQLLDKDKQIKIIFNDGDIIPAGGYYLLERTDDDSMPDAKADLIYTGALSNTDEALYLFDEQCNIEDEVLANPDWPGGDNLLKKPMERLDVLYWYAGVSTPGSDNSSPPVIHSSSAPTSSPILSSGSVSLKIFITETYIGNEDNQKDDFVELYNPNLEMVDLTDYYIQRKTEGAKDFSTYVSHDLLAGKKIEAQNYFLIANTSSTFATSADVVTTYPLTENNTLVLKEPKQEIVDQVSTGNPAAGKSYGRKWSSTTLSYTEDLEAQISTPRAQNQNSTVEEDEGDEGDGEEETGNDSLSVIINEIAWAGTKANHFDEWLELFINSTTTLDGWKILGSKNGTTTLEISLSGFASSSNYILIERTDENTVSDISADFFFSGGLDNDGMKLEIYNSNDVLIDAVDCFSGWFAGDNSTKRTMERINPSSGSSSDNWAGNNLIMRNGLDADGNQINGTPKAENSITKSFTEIIGGLNIIEDFTLTKLGSPYIIEGSSVVGAGAKLTIEPGVTMKFKHNEYWGSEFKVSGELEAIGGDTDDQKIIFTSFYDATGTTPAVGDWEWLYFENAQAKMDNVVIKYAGKKEGNPPFSPPFTRGAISIKGGNVEIKNSTIEKSQTLGLWLLDSADVLIEETEFLYADGDWEKAAAIFVENGEVTVKNSTFKDNKIGVLLENGDNSSFENNIFEENEIPIRTSTILPNFSGNIAGNNNFNGITIIGLGFSDSVSEIDWQPDDLPYVIESSVTVPLGKTLNIKSGTIIKFKESGCIYIEGTLNAQGAKEKEIVFTSLNDDEYGGDTNNDGVATQPGAGYWKSIYFYASSTNSILDNVIIRYGGWYNTFLGGADAKGGAVEVRGAALSIKNSVFENNMYCGLELIGSASEIKDTVFRGHTVDYFWGQRSAGLMLRDSIPIFKKADFRSNYHGVYVESGECPDLKEVTFGEGEEANSLDVYPSTCGP